MSKIKEALEEIFKKERIVFWYDDNQELRDEYNEVEIENVVKIEVKNNEFYIKYKVLKEAPAQKFLLYFAYTKPEFIKDWLLDLSLANYEFHTDKSAFYLQELNLDYEFRDFILEHIEFFKSKERINELNKLKDKYDKHNELRYKMLAVTCKSDNLLDDMLYKLFSELSDKKNDKFNNIVKFNLDTFFWQELEKRFNYNSSEKSLLDFLIELFKANFNIPKHKTAINREAIVFVNRWKDSNVNQFFFENLSIMLKEKIGVQEELEDIDYKVIVELDIFELIDQKIISGLKNDLSNETIAFNEAREIIDKRKVKFWYKNSHHTYEALEYAIEFLDLLKRIDIKISSLRDGFEKYIKTFYKLDYYYRKFIFHFKNAGQNNLLSELETKIEKFYSNKYLLTLNNNWQEHINKCEKWGIDGIILQRNFYARFIEPYIKKGIKIFVIISDGLRYESAVELLEKLLKEDRFKASMSCMLASMPSYTQLGMASLLPNKELTFKDKSGTVFVDGISSQGTPNRSKILNKTLEGRSIAIKAEDFLKLNTQTEGRDLSKNNDLVYIYSNKIDYKGDKKETEGDVFAETEEEFKEIIKILKKIANINISNVIITSDHGYIYQNEKLEESDFSEVVESEDQYLYDRRFIIGKNLNEQPSVKKFLAKELNLDDDTEFLITKSINRLRLKGSGSRYVHGGATLQEVVIPVIEFKKTRKDDVEKVDIDLIKTGSRITSNQISINLIQQQPIEEKYLPRKIVAGFYTKSGELISDKESIIFDSNNPDIRNREKRLKFTFSQDANKYNGQDIILKLEELIEGTNQFRLYKDFVYRMLISFTSDFDL